MPVVSDPPRSFRVTAWLAVLWNGFGVLTYLMTVLGDPAAQPGLTDAERALYTDVPAWATGAYAIAVFAGLLGSIGLVVRRAWAVPLLGLSLAAILVQMGHALLMTPLLEVQGAGAAILPVTILVVAVLLVVIAVRARGVGWLR